MDSFNCTSFAPLRFALVLAVALTIMVVSFISGFNSWRVAMTNHKPVMHEYLSLPEYSAQHRQAHGSTSQLLVAHMQGEWGISGWGNMFPMLMGVLPLAVILNRTLILKFGRPDIIASSIGPNQIDWRPWNSSVFARPKYWQLMNLGNMTEIECLDLQQTKVMHVAPGQLNLWENRHYSRWSFFLQAVALQRGLDLRTLTYAMVFEFLFRKTPALDQKINEIVTAVSPTGDPYVAIHVRTGSNELSEMRQSGWNNFVDMDSAMKAIPDAAMFAVNQSGLPASTKWLLATDDVGFAKKMRKKWPDHIIISNHRLPLKNGLHISRGGNEEGAILTFADWFVLTRSDILIQAGSSSFSSSAIWYRDGGQGGRLRCGQLQSDLHSAGNENFSLPITMCPSHIR